MGYSLGLFHPLILTIDPNFLGHPSRKSRAYLKAGPMKGKLPGGHYFEDAFNVVETPSVGERDVTTILNTT